MLRKGARLMRRPLLRALLVCSAGALVAVTIQPGAFADVRSNPVHMSAIHEAITNPIVRGLATPGVEQWLRRYNGLGNSDDVAKSLGVSPDGTKVFVTGASTGSGGDDDYATVAYDASTGARLWVARYNGPGNSVDTATSLGVTPTGPRCS
jgi:hypothetical protein